MKNDLQNRKAGLARMTIGLALPISPALVLALAAMFAGNVWATAQQSVAEPPAQPQAPVVPPFVR